MITDLAKPRRAKTASDDRGDRLLAHRLKLVAAQDAPHRRLLREYQRQCRKLFSKADLRTAADVVGRISKELHSSNPKIGSDSDERDARKVQARRKIDRLLAAALPSFRQWQALRKAHQREHRKLARLQFSRASSERVHVEWGDIVPTDDVDVQDFVAPFPVFDVHTIDEAELISRDQSFVANDTGNMMNAFDFNHSEDTAVIIGVLGLIRATPASGLVSCGINFTMPRSGRLQISAVLQNYDSEVLYSLRDKFGFSSGALDIRLQLFLATARGGSVVYMPTTVLDAHKDSPGDDVSGSMSGLDGSTPYTILGSTEESVPAGDSVQILAGSIVHIESELDDMASHVSAVVRWQLQRISVSVI